MAAVKKHNDALLKELQPGDLIEIQAYVIGLIPYYHWAVYIGECNESNVHPKT